jgi:hypothetical protein
MHFIRSLGKNQLLKNGFLVKKKIKVNNLLKFEEEDWFEGPPLSGLELFEGGRKNKISYKGVLQVTYRREREDIDYNHTRKRQKSKISFLEHGLTIYPNGYYENVKSLFIEGYWAWSEKIADMVPYDYVDTNSNFLKRN